MEQSERVDLSGASLEITVGWCKGCGLCVTACPKGILSLDVRGKIQAEMSKKCTGCGICESTCPDFAIAVRMKKYA
jgi:2-oxoglutarate ferredoxin oxidoreductase subunit delta